MRVLMGGHVRHEMFHAYSDRFYMLVNQDIVQASFPLTNLDVALIHHAVASSPLPHSEHRKLDTNAPPLESLV